MSDKPNDSSKKKFGPSRFLQSRPTIGGYYRYMEMMDRLELWPEKHKEKWRERALESK